MCSSDLGEKEDDTDDPNPSFKTEKTLENLPEKGYFTLGETAEFTIKVTNDGNLTLTDLKVTEMKGAVITAGEGYSVDGDTATIAQLKPGEDATIYATYTITEDDLGNKNLKNMVTVSGNGPDGHDPKDGGDKENIPVDDVTTVSGSKTWEDQSNLFGTRTESVTIRLQADGSEIKSTTTDAAKGWAYSFTKLPVHTAAGTEVAYTVTEDEVTGYDTTIDGYNVINTLKQFTLHIDYVYVRSTGGTEHQAFPSVDKTVSYGEPYAITSPSKSGYSVDIAVVEGVITDNVTVKVTYTANPYKLTISYVFEDGTEAAPTYAATLIIGDSYGVTSPTIDGYVASIEYVSGKMGAADKSYVIVYRPIATPVVGNVTLNLSDCFE